MNTNWYKTRAAALVAWAKHPTTQNTYHACDGKGILPAMREDSGFTERGFVLAADLLDVIETFDERFIIKTDDQSGRFRRLLGNALSNGDVVVLATPWLEGMPHSPCYEAPEFVAFFECKLDATLLMREAGVPAPTLPADAFIGDGAQNER